MLWAGTLAVLAAVVTLVVLAADRPPDPVLVEEGAPTPVEGFGEIGFRVEGVNNTGAAERCALLADTPEQRARGLMNRTDLAGYAGMLFRFDEDTTTAFYMKDTPLPLSIAWFDASGAFVSSADMEPCLGRRSCPTYAPAGPYRFALEVPQGGLPALDVGRGSRLVVGTSCP